MTERKRKVRPDWSAIERDYRLGQLTLRELAAKYGNVTHQGIANRAKAEGWKRDLTNAVKAATRAVVIERTVAEAVAKTGQSLTDEVAAVATVHAEVIGRHRRSAARLHAVQDRLAQELIELDMAAERGRLAVERLLEGCPEEQRKDLQSVAKPILADLAKSADIAHRVGCFDALTRAAERVQRMERACYNLDDQLPPDDTSLEALLEKAELNEWARRASDAVVRVMPQAQPPASTEFSAG
jgi:hypothetical protein